MKRAIIDLIEWLAIIAVGVILAQLLKTYVLINSVVPTGSMESTIMINDRLIGNRLAFRSEDPQRGDIVIFNAPYEANEDGMLLIKRVIGTPGDIIEIHDGCVFVNNEKLNEPYLHVITEGTFGPYLVPDDSYFMMGDNRNHSTDSRYWTDHFIKRDEILAKAIFRYWPNFTAF